MRYVITESRLNRVFGDYMDSQFDLYYDGSREEFITKDEEIFGYMMGDMGDQFFYYGDYSTHDSLNSLFGRITDDLLLNYLRGRFPEIEIDGVDYDPYQGN